MPNSFIEALNRASYSLNKKGWIVMMKNVIKTVILLIFLGTFLGAVTLLLYAYPQIALIFVALSSLYLTVKECEEKHHAKY